MKNVWNNAHVDKLSNLYNIYPSYDWTNHIICWSYYLDLSKKLDNRSSISFLLLSVILSGILLLLKKWLKSLLPSEISSIFLLLGSENPLIVSTAYLLCIGIRSSTESYNEFFCFVVSYHIPISFYSNLKYIKFRELEQILHDGIYK